MPDDDASTFTSSSTILNRIWVLAQHSALYGSQEQFIDTPTRERGQFGQDASNISSTTQVAFAERNLTWQRCATSRDLRIATGRWTRERVYPNGDGKRDIPISPRTTRSGYCATTTSPAIRRRSRPTTARSRTSGTTSCARWRPRPGS